jgi:peptidoglycan/LPS O-acetylase OafA/YrhL
MAAGTQHQIRSLTGLRFFAAALVVVFHFARPHDARLMTFIDHGAVGVMLFFVLSGFILSYSYSLGPGRLRGDLRSFWVARFARLYPVYLLGILLFVPIMLRATDVPLWQRVAAAGLSLGVTQAWFHVLGMAWGMWNPPGWSLSAEAFFYLVFPIACLPMSRLPVRRLLAVALICWVLSVAGLFTDAAIGFGKGDFWAFVPLIRLPEFLLGMACELAWKSRRTQAFDRAAPYAAAVSTLLLIAAMCLPISATLFFSGVFAPVAGLLICSLACGKGLLVRCLSSRPIVFLGGASYSLYILHWPFWLLGKHFFSQSRFATQQPNLYFIAYFLVTTVAACICFTWLEEPLNSLLRRKLMRPPAQASQAPPVEAGGMAVLDDGMQLNTGSTGI